MNEKNLIKYFEMNGFIYYKEYENSKFHKIFYMYNDDVIIRLTVERTYPRGYCISFYVKSLYQDIDDNFYKIMLGTNWDRYYHETIFNNYDDVIEFLNQEKIIQLKNIDSPEKLLSLINFTYNLMQEKSTLYDGKKYNLITSDIKIALNLCLKKYDLAKKALNLRIKWNEITIQKIKEGLLKTNPCFKTYNLDENKISKKLLTDNQNFKILIELIDNNQASKIRNMLIDKKSINLKKFKERLNIKC